MSPHSRGTSSLRSQRPPIACIYRVGKYVRLRALRGLVIQRPGETWPMFSAPIIGEQLGVLIILFVTTLPPRWPLRRTQKSKLQLAAVFSLWRSPTASEATGGSIESSTQQDHHCAQRRARQAEHNFYLHLGTELRLDILSNARMPFLFPKRALVLHNRQRRRRYRTPSPKGSGVIRTSRNSAILVASHSGGLFSGNANRERISKPRFGNFTFIEQEPNRTRGVLSVKKKCVSVAFGYILPWSTVQNKHLNPSSGRFETGRKPHRSSTCGGRNFKCLCGQRQYETVQSRALIAVTLARMSIALLSDVPVSGVYAMELPYDWNAGPMAHSQYTHTNASAPGSCWSDRRSWLTSWATHKPRVLTSTRMSTIPMMSPGELESVPIVVIVPALQTLLIVIIFSSFLVPTTIALFVSSTPAHRRLPTFILNLCAIILGLAQGAILSYLSITELTNKTTNQRLISASIGLYVVLPICVQTILLFRIIAVYPPRSLPIATCIGLYGPAIAMKAARVANACYLIYSTQRGKEGVPKTVASQSAAIWTSPYAKSEWFLQLADDVFVSTLFLMRIQQGIKFSGKHTSKKRYDGHSATVSYAARLQTLFWIALSNFVFPVIFDIAQLVMILRDSNYIDGSRVVSVNTYVSILGVLFSTIWATGSLHTSESSVGQTSLATNIYSTRMPSIGRAPLVASRNLPYAMASSATLSRMSESNTVEKGSHEEDA
ncbi:hypothetical protein DICSQDRAFT_128637 [Dichomitus squalens LYAD-421 SS1]|uniref:Uncharacterized protein n=1 Tax=Dichomitus squalens (strain LYAD-421) TaxID=732165 RepID=R7SVC0_DICSQ|nr:uncharacterized protein DICSQDRAFT_128637 [Dichomitus squalens LYAD-421 SS1]EJF58932.1 hypothetical protein DICSQDRAFT_128637 [Dichomitus squalens LYAD-421 SS1]